MLVVSSIFLVVEFLLHYVMQEQQCLFGCLSKNMLRNIAFIVTPYYLAFDKTIVKDVFWTKLIDAFQLQELVPELATF